MLEQKISTIRTVTLQSHTAIDSIDSMAITRKNYSHSVHTTNTGAREGFLIPGVGKNFWKLQKKKKEKEKKMEGKKKEKEEKKENRKRKKEEHK